jgi:calcium-binding protein CML
MTVFGIINEVGGYQGLVTFILVLALLVVLEYLFEKLGKYARRHGYETIYEKLKKELTILGIISFTVFIYQAAAGDGNYDYFVAFELAHIIVLFIAIAFIMQALLLIHYAYIGGQRLLGAIRTPFEDMVHEFNNLMTAPKSFAARAFNILPSWIPLFPKLRSNVEYRIIEKFFLSQHPLPSGFRFSKYATILFTDFISELGDIGPFSWACIGVFVAINYGRIIYVDNSAKSSICHGYDHASAYHNSTYNASDHHYDDYVAHDDHDDDHFKHALATGCVDYTLRYGLFCGFVLSLFILILYIVTGVYYDRMIFKILQWDGVDVKKPGRQMYSEFLENAASDESQYKNLTQRSMLKMSSRGENEGSRHDFGIGSIRNINGVKITQVGDIYDKDDNEVALMSIEEYKREMDYNKLRQAHETEMKISQPIHMRLYLSLKEMFIDAPDTSSNHNSHKHRSVSNIDEKTEEGRQRSESVVADHPESVRKQRVIENIFIFRSPSFHVAIVGLALLIQCFYISVWGTQLIPLAKYAKFTHPAFFITVSCVMIVFTSFLQESILHQTVLLQTVVRLHLTVVDKVCDQLIEESNVLTSMRRSIIEELEGKSSDKKFWRKYVKDKFAEFDLSGDGYMSSAEFRNFLGSLNIFMPKERFDIIWESVDLDQSGAITWDELFVLVFPEFKYDLKEQMVLLDDLRTKLKKMLKSRKVSKKRRIPYLESVFKKFDSDNSAYIEKDEFESLLAELGMTDYTEKQFHMMFLAADTNADNKLSFAEFCDILNLHVDETAAVDDGSDEKSEVDEEIHHDIEG